MPIGGSLRLKGIALPTQKNTNYGSTSSSKTKSKKRKRSQDSSRTEDKGDSVTPAQKDNEINDGNSTSLRHNTEVLVNRDEDDDESLLSETHRRKKTRRDEDEGKKKKKKKEKKNKRVRSENSQEIKKKDESHEKTVKYNEFYVPVDDEEVQRKTIAEQIFDKVRHERDKIKYENMTSLSYDKKVQEFNEKLGKMRDHNSIPKISSASNG